MVMILLVAPSLNGLSLLFAQTASPPVSALAIGPQARFSASPVDFGRVMPTEIRHHVFIVTNAGTGVLIISNVAPGCGCTTAGEWDREIPPGKTGRIPIEFNPANFSGAVTKSIVVSSNDAVQSTHVLEIQATVWRPFEVVPAQVSFLPIEGEPTVETKVVRILNNLDQPATLEPPQSINPQFKTALKTIRPGREFAVHISYDSAIPNPSHHTAITIKTSFAEQPVLNISAFAMPQPAVVTLPAAIQLPPGPRGPNYSYNVVIRNNASAALRVTEPVASVKGLVVTLTEPQPGRLFYLNVAMPDEFKAQAENPAMISVKTSHPRFPEIRVPIIPSAVPPAPPAATVGK